MSAPDLEQLMELINKVKGRQTTLDRVASQPIANQPWRQPGASPQNAAQFAMGQGVEPSQGRALNQLYGSILNRQPGQTRIGAATEGFEKGSQLIDQIREKERAGRLQSAQIGVEGAQNDLKNNSAMYGLGVAADNEEYKRQRDKIEDEQWAKELAENGNIRVFASQVKAHESTINDLRESRVSATAATNLVQDIDQIATQVPGGLQSTINEWLKQASGNRDQVSVLRTRANKLINSEIVKALPKGPASDKDIAIIERGMPPANATLGELREFAEAIARVERQAAKYHGFKEQYMSDNNYDLRGFPKAWDELLKTEEEAMGGTPAAGAVLTYDPATGTLK